MAGRGAAASHAGDPLDQKLASRGAGRRGIVRRRWRGRCLAGGRPEEHTGARRCGSQPPGHTGAQRRLRGRSSRPPSLFAGAGGFHSAAQGAWVCVGLCLRFSPPISADLGSRSLLRHPTVPPSGCPLSSFAVPKLAQRWTRTAAARRRLPPDTASGRPAAARNLSQHAPVSGLPKPLMPKTAPSFSRRSRAARARRVP